jgi:PAS domain S-box-containing protein
LSKSINRGNVQATHTGPARQQLRLFLDRQYQPKHPKRLEKNAAVITDLTKTRKALKNKAVRIFEQYGDKLSFQYLEDLTVEDLMERVAHLPDDTIIFLFIFSRDRAGRVFSHERNLSLLRQHASVPICAVWEFYLGHGIIGGKLTSGKAEGKMAAELAIRIINGEKAAAIPLQTSPTQYMFDHGQLERFNVDMTTLPPGSIVITRPFSLYDAYKSLIWSTIAVLVILVAIITMLAYNIVLWKKAEEESRARAAELTLNVAERKDSQVSLRESEHKFRSFFDSNPDSIIMMDLDGIIRSVNKSFIQAADYMYNEIIGRHYSDFLLEEYHGETLKRFAHLKAGIVHDSDLEVEYIRKDGDRIPVRIKGWQIVDEENHAMRDKGGKLTVTLENVQVDTPKQFLNMKIAPGSYARLAIQDNGKGIAATTINRIFEPFFPPKPAARAPGWGCR